MRQGEYPPASSQGPERPGTVGQPCPPPDVADGIADDDLATRPRSTADGGKDDATDDPRSEIAALRALGFAKPLLAEMAARAVHNGTSVETELLASGTVSDTAYYGAIARLLRLPFLDRIDPALLVQTAAIDSQLARPTMVRIAHKNRAQDVAVIPEARRLADLAVTLITMPTLGRNLVVTTPTAVRTAVWEARACARVRETTGALFERAPHLSARFVLTGAQGGVAGVLLTAFAFLTILKPLDTALGLHVALSLSYFTAFLLRMAALIRKLYVPERRRPARKADDDQRPVYTVLVALYREEAVVPQLIAHLQRLDWPPSLLDIRLVCEADDHATIAAIRACSPGPQFEIIEVPPYGPRTKPKALTYALSGVRGEYLAIYDAEDRPHPEQLREAYSHFLAAPDTLACLQAPLVITNLRQTWLTAIFSLEYSGLFRALLPMLGRHRMPLPLGGTSNHFRTAALVAAGGWDPYNVTEDADMGLRLFRLGYTADVLTRPTLEEAPTTLPVWLGQRTRWYKGWLQTWLVLMRNPRRLTAEMGMAAFCVFQLLVGGMLLSALLHPLIIIFFAVSLWQLLAPPAHMVASTAKALFIIDTANILGSYLIFVGLGLGAMIDYEKRLLGWKWMGVPAYWMMTSLAACARSWNCGQGRSTGRRPRTLPPARDKSTSLT